MPIQANVTNNQITAQVGETQIDVNVSGGFGPSGAAGAAGQAATITVGTVTTGAPGSSASVVNGGSSSAAVLNFTIPAGATGATGAQGERGLQGERGEQGIQGIQGIQGPAGATGATGPAGTTTWAGITDKPSTFAPSTHTHDDRYYTESEVDTLLAGKQATGSYVLTTDARLSDARQPLTHTHTASQISDFTSAVIAAAPPTTNASLLTSGTLPDARLSSNIARTSDVTAAVAAVIDAAPASLDTLNELAAALGDDANFASTVTNALAAKAPLASPTFTGTVSGITKSMVGLGNVPNVDATARANHTGTQSASTITGLATVATSGAYADLSGTPAAYSLPTASSTVTGGVRIGSGVSIDGSGVISVSTNYAAASHTHTSAAISDFATAAASAAPVQSVAGRTGAVTIAAADVSGLGSLATQSSVAYSSLTGTPSTFAPSAHKSTHATGGSDALTPADIGAAAVGHAHPATDITSGTIATDRLGSGSATSTTFLAGDQTWKTVSGGSSSASDLTSGTLSDARLSSNVLLASRKPELITNRSALRLFYSRWLSALQNTGPNRRISTMIAGDSLAGRLAGWLHAEIQMAAQFWGSRGIAGEQQAGPLWTNGFSPSAGLSNSIVGLGTAYGPTLTSGPIFSGGWMSGIVFDVSAPVTLSASGSGTSLTVTGATVTTTATASSGSTSLTLASASGVFAGMTITGTGIQANTRIAWLSGTTATLTAATNAPISSGTVTIALPISSAAGRMTVSENASLAAGTEATAISGSTVTLGTAATSAVSGTVDFSSYLQFPGPQQFGSFAAQRFGVYYIQQPSGGSFVLEYATSATAATWTQVGSAISTSGTLEGRVSSASLPSRNRYWFRARVTSGTVRFISGWYDEGGKTVRGSDGIGASAGGISPSQGNQCEAAIVTPILAHMDPALVTFHYDDLNCSADLGALLAKMRGTVTRTCSGTAAQSTITVNNSAGLYVGMTAFSADGASVPGTAITAISGTTVTLSAANPSTFSNASVTFRTPCPALVIANHAKVGEADATTRESVTNWQNNATTFDYAVFDALSAMGTAGELQAMAQQGDGTHLSNEAYAVGGHLLTTDLMTPIQGFIAGKGYTTGLNATTLGVNTIRLGDTANGATWVTQGSTNPPAGLITTSTSSVNTDLARDYVLRDSTGAKNLFRITGNPFAVTNLMSQAPLVWQPLETSFASYASSTGGVTTWAEGQSFRLRQNSNNQRLNIGPIVATASLDIPSVPAVGEVTVTVTVTGAIGSSNSVVQLGWSAALPAGIVVAQAWVSANNTVSIRFYNYTAAAIDPAALTCNVAVMEVA